MRKIIHIDMDAFFVSVEIRDDPSLQGKPVAVGGKSTRRGVIATCNYQARQFGVRSAMASARAFHLCPELILVPGRMSVYQQVSMQIREIFAQFTDLIEPLSLDEAYLDVSHCTCLQGSATLIAQQIRQQIYQTTGLTASAGIAPIKFLAKVASDENKPNGQLAIPPEQVTNFIDTMALEKISGVGKVTLAKLHKLALFTGKDVRNSSEHLLKKHLGHYGLLLWQRCHGRDDRAIQTSRVRKSIGVERTFAEDIVDSTRVKQLMYQDLLPELVKRVERQQAMTSVSKLGVKVKFADFVQTTKECKQDKLLINTFESLLDAALARGQGKAVRLLGVHIGLADPLDKTGDQLELLW